MHSTFCLRLLAAKYAHIDIRRKKKVEARENEEKKCEDELLHSAVFHSAPPKKAAKINSIFIYCYQKF